MPYSLLCIAEGVYITCRSDWVCVCVVECKPSNPEKLGLHYEGLLRIVKGFIYPLEQKIVTAEYENNPTSLADWDIHGYYI